MQKKITCNYQCETGKAGYVNLLDSLLEWNPK